MKEVILNGFLGERYIPKMSMKASRINEIFACLECNFPDFRRDMIEFAEAGGDISIMYGDKILEDEEELLYSIGADTIVITPLPAGAKGGGAKLLLAALIVASFFIPGSGALLVGGLQGTALAGSSVSAAGALSAGAAATAAGYTTAVGLNMAGLALAGLATNLAITGLQQIMAPDPSVDAPDANDDYLFSNPESTVAQNNVVPVLFGEMIVSGVLISTSTLAESPTNTTYGQTYTFGSAGFNPSGILPPVNNLASVVGDYEVGTHLVQSLIKY